MPTISIELPSHIIEWLEFLKASDDEASLANALPPDSTVGRHDTEVVNLSDF